MSAPREALLFLDLDKGGERLLEEERALLKHDPRLRSGWLQYQALQALALETAPAPSEKMLRAVLERCRQEKVSRQLARIAGGDEMARQILLGRPSKGMGASPWILAGLLLGALALGWVTFRGSGLSRDPGLGIAGGAPADHDEPVPFEFPVQTPPAEAALSAPVDGAADSDADDVHGESPAARQASRLLREHLHEVQERDHGTTAPAQRAATAEPSPVPTEKPAAAEAAPAPTKRSEAVAAPSEPAKDAAPGLGAELILSSDTLLASAQASAANPSPAKGATAQPGPLDILVGMPQRRDIDVRLFSPSGKPACVLGSGRFGPGKVHFTLNAADGHGRAWTPGTYFLRVMTPWFSRVIPIQIH